MVPEVAAVTEWIKNVPVPRRLSERPRTGALSTGRVPRDDFPPAYSPSSGQNRSVTILAVV